MFGYIGVCKPELKVKEYETFKAYYCGLCHALGREYSHKARLLLSYDCTFLYLFSDALAQRMPLYKKQRCIIHPVNERATTDGQGAEFAAAVNVLLSVASMKDHVSDDNSFKHRTGNFVYSSEYKKASKKYPDIYKIIHDGINRLHAVECDNVKDIDLAANEFAQILKGIFALIDNNKAVASVGYELGRWIYLIDALDDFNKDVSSGNYNPFVAKFGCKYNNKIKECAEFNLNSSVTNAAMALDLIDLNKHEGIIKNIIYLGLYRKMNEVFERLEKVNGPV